MKPRCIVIAGPNGAGKTTFAREFLPKEGAVVHFVNADLIAAGLRNDVGESRGAVTRVRGHDAHRSVKCFQVRPAREPVVDEHAGQQDSEQSERAQVDPEIIVA